GPPTAAPRTAAPGPAGTLPTHAGAGTARSDGGTHDGPCGGGAPGTLRAPHRRIAVSAVRSALRPCRRGGAWPTAGPPAAPHGPGRPRRAARRPPPASPPGTASAPGCRG